ncbi:AlpA family phage regulatory protein [Shewanella sp. TB4-MNA-CIBAN-0142]|uniref:helix-turn-helix transcriptional regulator n=1 Tax=Shewanella sp. TB4-MNA-CIBAN-0142 TaxID=3140464 RepID=UPI003318DA2A
MQNKPNNITDQVIRLKDVILITGLSRSTIYAKQNPKSKWFDPLFPKKISLGARAVGWLKQELEAWLSEMINKSISGSDHGSDVRPVQAITFKL